MGRLVYVREVYPAPSLRPSSVLTVMYRIERQNHASLGHQVEVILAEVYVEATKVHQVVVQVVQAAQHSVVLWAALADSAVVLAVAVVDNFTSRTCVASRSRDRSQNC